MLRWPQCRPAGSGTGDSDGNACGVCAEAPVCGPDDRSAVPDDAGDFDCGSVGLRYGDRGSFRSVDAAFRFAGPTVGEPVRSDGVRRNTALHCPNCVKQWKGDGAYQPNCVKGIVEAHPQNCVVSDRGTGGCRRLSGDWVFAACCCSEPDDPYEDVTGGDAGTAFAG